MSYPRDTSTAVIARGETSKCPRCARVGRRDSNCTRRGALDTQRAREPGDIYAPASAARFPPAGLTGPSVLGTLRSFSIFQRAGGGTCSSSEQAVVVKCRCTYFPSLSSINRHCCTIECTRKTTVLCMDAQMVTSFYSACCQLTAFGSPSLLFLLSREKGATFPA